MGGINLAKYPIIMTMFHFGNCVALAFGPYVLTYKYSGLPEYSAFWKCVQASGIYMITQLCKMLMLATFFPTTDIQTNSLATEIAKTTVDFGDIIGLGVVMSRMNAMAHIKILVAGLGWAWAELVVTCALPLWVGARGLEFDWKYIMMSLEANVNLVQHLCTTVLVWLWWRTTLATIHRSVVAALLVVTVYRPVVPMLIAALAGSAPQGLSLVGALATPTLCSTAITTYLYISHTSPSKSY